MALLSARSGGITPTARPQLRFGRLGTVAPNPAAVAYCANPQNPCVMDPNTGQLIPRAYASEIPNDNSSAGGTGPGAPITPFQASGTPTEGEAYWSAQPAAVQALQNLPPNSQARADLATQLANQGYTIDTQIMVMGWDPQMTMAARQGYGYSWVPAWGQAPVQVEPGMSFPGLDSYNPNNPPPGSIKVSTAFANGTIQNPAVAGATDQFQPSQVVSTTTATPKMQVGPLQAPNVLNTTAPGNVKINQTPPQSNALVTGANQTNPATPTTAQIVAGQNVGPSGTVGVGANSTPPSTLAGAESWITQNWVLLAAGAAALLILPGLFKGGRD